MSTKKNKVSRSSNKLLSVYEYSKDFDVCEAVPNPEPLPGKDLLEPVAILKEKPAEKWRDKDVLPIAKLIAGRISIDATGDNRSGANAFGQLAKNYLIM
ncbi:hypothetical protein RclHR1_01720018 [Rhizophagus clarus]|uniref:Uncharacterized protein n=1 Tax=Rhizophagus clarus TaxID=94130 RepID=A0A2Z6QJL8_9GLOM|nr:hypothetical protein RclHR1_01720018 [Rhizophagus clarus]GES99593.1 hypothetical protein GLOIN_2v1719369 [Rhizophagus clarus]